LDTINWRGVDRVLYHFLILAYILHMALTNNGTRVDLGAGQLPSGYTKPNITTFADHEAKYSQRSFTVVKATVDEASGITTFDAILTDLNAQITTLLTADLNVAALTVDAFAVMTSLRTNTKVSEEFYTNVAVNYLIVVDIFWKTA